MNIPSPFDIAKPIAKLGQNPEFVAFMAHCFFAAFVVQNAIRVAPWWLVVPLALILAGWKEFYFDARQEKDPPQTWRGNAMDFAGYVVGIGLGLC